MDGDESDASQQDLLLVGPQTNKYVSEIKTKAGLVLHEPDRIRTALQYRGHLDLFTWFIPKATIERFRLCTNSSQQLATSVTQPEMRTFFGLLFAV